MAVCATFLLIAGLELAQAWGDDLATLIGRIDDYAGNPLAAQPSGPTGEIAEGMFDNLRQAADDLVTCGTYKNPSTEAAWASLSECMTWIRANASSYSAYFADDGLGGLTWTAESGEPVGQWWNEIYAVLTEMTYVGVNLARHQDAGADTTVGHDDAGVHAVQATAVDDCFDAPVWGEASTDLAAGLYGVTYWIAGGLYNIRHHAASNTTVKRTFYEFTTPANPGTGATIEGFACEGNVLGTVEDNGAPEPWGAAWKGYLSFGTTDPDDAGSGLLDDDAWDYGTGAVECMAAAGAADEVTGKTVTARGDATLSFATTYYAQLRADETGFEDKLKAVTWRAVAEGTDEAERYCWIDPAATDFYVKLGFLY